MDETGKFFRALPNRSLDEGSKNCIAVQNGKCNASRGKEKSIVIGKSAKPRCFKGIRDMDELPCQHYNQRKA